MNNPLFSQPPNTVFILGAGFSCGLGLPSQEKLSELLLTPDFRVPSEADNAITIILKDFFQKVFNAISPKNIPSLEDVFTFIDLSAGTGHNLGRDFPPNKLRAIRRLFIHRILRILDAQYEADRPLAIQDFLGSIPGIGEAPLETAFAVLNWDIVLEKQLCALPINAPIDYCCDCEDYDNQNNLPLDRRLRICKMHGSGNWVYCDCCRRLYYRVSEKLALTSGADINKDDFNLFSDILGNEIIPNDQINVNNETILKCKYCQNKLSFHITTFSYRKSFRNPAYMSIWSSTEKILSSSSNWVFIGYSLPEADYEMKHLLKSAQLQKNVSKRIMVVDPNPNVHDKYRRLFGDIIESYVSRFDDMRVLQAIRTLN